MDGQQDKRGTTQALPELERVVGEFLQAKLGDEMDPMKDRIRYQHEQQNELLRLAKRLGPKYWQSSLEGFQVYDQRQKPVIEQLRLFAEDMPARLEGGRGVILLGKPGTGKDHCLAALLRIAVAKHRFRADWYDGGDLLDRIHHATMNDSFLPLKRDLLNRHILAISDPIPPRGDFSRLNSEGFAISSTRGIGPPCRRGSQQTSRRQRWPKRF